MIEVAMSDVFLSCSHKSRKHAEMLASELQSLGISVWVASKEIQNGDAVEEKILEGIRSARLVAFLVDRQSSSAPSSWVEREYMAALEHSWADEDKILLPVLVDDAEPPAFLRHASAIKVRSEKSDWSRAAEALAKVLREGNVAKRNKAPMREQARRLNLIEREAKALRAVGGVASRKS